MNPELRATLNSISRNLESANETAQENIYTFSHNYIDPCLASLRLAFEGCTQCCFPEWDERWDRRRRRQREDVSFGFYDDWEDESEDELGALLTNGGRSASGQTGSKGGYSQGQRRMDYGTRGLKRSAYTRHDEDGDPTVIPSSSYLGFLERLPWRLGAKGLRYKPSAADLQENLGGEWRSGQLQEEEPLIEDTSEESGEDQQQKAWTRAHTRQRSGTANSRSTTNSLSSRGDLIPSDEELESDAVPLDDEFAMGLERRTTGTTSDDHSSGRTGEDKKSTQSRTSTRTVSSKSLKSLPKSILSGGRKNSQEAQRSEVEVAGPEGPSLTDLKLAEERLRDEEEGRVEKNRAAARKLAADKGLDVLEVLERTNAEVSFDN